MPRTTTGWITVVVILLLVMVGGGWIYSVSRQVEGPTSHVGKPSPSGSGGGSHPTPSAGGGGGTGTGTPTPTPKPKPKPKPVVGPAIRILDYVAAADVSPPSFAARNSAQFRDPLVFGISWKFSWRALEPGANVYDWHLVDQAIQVTSRAGKKSAIRVYSGIQSPAWIYSVGGTAFNFFNTDVGNPAGYPPTLRMPVPWGSVYLSYWTNFIRAFGQRYNGNPNIYLIEMAGGGFIGEMALPHASARVIAAWRAAGYSDAALIGAWRRIIDAYRSVFFRTPSGLAFGEPLGVGVSAVMLPVTNYVLSRYPGQVYLQENGLQASYINGLNKTRQVIRGASGRTVVGYQMEGGSVGPLNLKTGDRRTAFTVAIQDHATYVEVYSTDLANPALRAAIIFLASAGKL